MTDNYNDDYREVIPEEEKTETNVSETQDNEKNNRKHTGGGYCKRKFQPKKSQRTKRTAANTKMSALSAADRRAWQAR